MISSTYFNQLFLALVIAAQTAATNNIERSTSDSDQTYTPIGSGSTALVTDWLCTVGGRRRSTKMSLRPCSSLIGSN